MKKSTAVLWIAVAGIIAAVFCVLYISGMIRKDAEIESLKGSTLDQAARIMELDADNAEKDTRIGDLSANKQQPVENRPEQMPGIRRKQPARADQRGSGYRQALLHFASSFSRLIVAKEKFQTPAVRQASITFTSASYSVALSARITTGTGWLG